MVENLGLQTPPQYVNSEPGIRPIIMKCTFFCEGGFLDILVATGLSETRSDEKRLLRSREDALMAYGGASVRCEVLLADGFSRKESVSGSIADGSKVKTSAL